LGFHPQKSLELRVKLSGLQALKGNVAKRQKDKRVTVPSAVTDIRLQPTAGVGIMSRCG
jgi:hypothetical protein